MSELVKASSRVAKIWATRLKESAQGFAPRHIAPKINSNVKSVGEGAWNVSLWVAKSSTNLSSKGKDDSFAQEFGSGTRATRGKTDFITIRPVKKKFLAFIVQNPIGGQPLAMSVKTRKPIKTKSSGALGKTNINGGIVFAQEVQHPGIHPFNGEGYIRPAVKEWRATMKKEAPELTRAIKADLRTMFAKSFSGGKK